MLLNLFKTGTIVSTPACRNGALARKSSTCGRPDSLQARASASAEGGWLKSASSKLGKVGSYVEQKVQGSGKESVGETVTFKGTVVVVKKLKLFDVMDRVADIQDDASELRGKKVTFQLVSSDVDSNTGELVTSTEVSLQGWLKIFDSITAEKLSFTVEFSVPKAFGVPGAIFVRNNHPNEFLLVSFKLDLPGGSSADFITNSWVYNTEKSGPRAFFTNTPLLPHETPAGLKELREKELRETRGDGTGMRNESERIYDYDVYNDLGKPDDDPKNVRPTLGGSAELPFPRRMRTGRPLTKFSPEFESRAADLYVPSDERFDYVKLSDNKADMARAAAHAIPSKISAKLSKKESWSSIEEIKNLYSKPGEEVGGINNVLGSKENVSEKDQHPLLFLREFTSKRADGEDNELLKFPLPRILKADEKAWQTDAEFAREYLAGFNPIEIQLVREFPMKSKLDPAEFGDPNSAITEQHIEGKLEGFNVAQAVSEKKLFVVDFHDLFLPWVGSINKLENSKNYATRTLFFLSKEGSLKPVAIELVLPPKTKGGEKKARVFTPPADPSETDHLWQLAKAHATNNEMTVHQSVNHFTRCHAVTEPMIIATHRQLSKLHPIHHLMFPHCRHTLEVNSTARLNLLPAGGTIEQIYTPREYVVRMASCAYRDLWSFDSNALPNDLIKRGMAELDSSAKHGVRLTIEDYPYAADGLEVWGAMKEWNMEYVDIYYKDDSAVQQDGELQNWYNEYRNVGHADKRDAPGWTPMDSKKNLVEILTTVQWIPTAMHAPINFGQFDYAGFMPHHPCMCRRLIPEEGSKEMEELRADPVKFYLSTISDTDTTTTAMAVFEVVAAHAPNEEYIVERIPTWTQNEQAKAAFQRYTDKLREIDDLIVRRNKDPNLKHRCGPAQLPFELLRPFSTPGVTGRGIPNSITV